MKRNNKLSQQFSFRMLLVMLLIMVLNSVFLQSCFSSTNLLNQGEGCGDAQLEGEFDIISIEAKGATELGKFEMLPIELLEEILSYVSVDQIKEVREVNRICNYSDPPSMQL